MNLNPGSKLMATYGWREERLVGIQFKPSRRHPLVNVRGSCQTRAVGGTLRLPQG